MQNGRVPVSYVLPYWHLTQAVLSVWPTRRAVHGPETVQRVFSITHLDKQLKLSMSCPPKQTPRRATFEDNR